MPTPVSVAREHLTDESARVLDDAVSVARRRSHSQTTSLHVISALLSLPSSSLRDACTSRAKSSAYSTRLQFRALELCVGVSLDRVPSSKAVEEPPVSNSLMAAIKRSQANQRRNPESFQLQQIHYSNNNNQTTSCLKVELKYFIISILDDPTVSKVLGEAGFRSTEIKLAIIHPPVSKVWSNRTRCPPPIFLCNLTDNLTGPSSSDENCRRISEVLANKKNPLLVGACGFDALKRFVEFIDKDSVLGGLSVVSVEGEITEFVNGGDKGKLGVRFEEVGGEIERCLGSGIVVNVGDLKFLFGDNVSSDGASFVVEKLTALLLRLREKMWLIAAAASYEVYMKFLGQFPSVEKDWDLQLLPITSSTSSVDSFGSKSSLMGSFVPLGGFFSMPTDFRSPLSGMSQSTTIARCHLCTAKYEQELAAMLKTGAAVSVADQYAENLPSWLRMAELETSKVMDATKVKDDGVTLNAKVLVLQKKWNDMCQRLHHAQPLSAFEIPRSASLPQFTVSEGSNQVAERKSSSNSSSRDSALNIGKHANPSIGVDMDSPKTFPLEHTMPISITSRGDGSNFQSKVLEDVSRNQEKEKDNEIPWITRHSLPSSSLPTDRTSSSSVTSVTTDLGLGTIYASRTWETNSRILRDREELRLHYSAFSSTEYDTAKENASQQVAQSSCTGPSVGVQFDSQEYKSMRRALSEKVGWQYEAICTIVDAILCCRAGYGKNGGSNSRKDIWLTFLGPDRVGKKRIASILTQTLFGSLESFLSVDCCYGEFSPLNTIVGYQESNDYDVKFRGKTVVDYVATELRKKPHSLVFLENVDKADPQTQSSLSQAIRTGRFPDSYGREISITNTIFITTSTLNWRNKNPVPGKEANKFCEERILGAQRLQMKLISEMIADSAGIVNDFNASASEDNLVETVGTKRKLVEVSYSLEQDKNTETKERAYKSLRTHLDLNLPVEETDVDASYCECESDTISEASDPWLEEFFDQVDAKVEFKPFNFKVLAENMRSEITKKFLKTHGSEIPLEIEDEVIVQIIAASWLSDRRGAIEEWVETVLSKGFTELRQRYEPSSSSCRHVVKLISCKDLVAEEQALGICLPARINL